jgi:hypothetical protein
MKRIFSNKIAALAVGLCLRLFFVLRFPANSGDTILYEQIATNWLKHGTYAMNVGGAVTPVDLRMPGYPAYLALVYAITGRTGAEARLWVMLGQAVVDLLGCVVIAALAVVMLFPAIEGSEKPKRVFLAALWLAVLCPFTANYTAVPLTEVFAAFLTGAALVFFLKLMQVYISGVSLALPIRYTRLRAIVGRHLLLLLIAAPGLAVGIATLFRPESPLLLVAALVVVAFVVKRGSNWQASLQIVAMSAAMCMLPLVPWAFRNFVTLHEVQFLAPKNSNLPGELVPYGFMAWEKTWLYKVRDCYLVTWKLDDESIDVDSLPGRAFDTAEEKERVAAILEKYNDDLTLTPDEDAAFGQIARERNARHPLRTYLWLPVARAFTIWFTPRIELVPVSGNVFPLRQMWEDDRTDQTVTVGFFLLNIAYVGLGVCGAARLWRCGSAVRPAVVLIIVFLLLRTAFLTTLEAPEPRYVIVCFPALIALGAQVFVRRREST